MLSETQCAIVHEVCSIQYQSLTNLLIEPNVTGPDGKPMEEIFEDLGINRKEFDTELIQTIHTFEHVKNNPEEVFNMGELDLLVFSFILNKFDHHWREKGSEDLDKLKGKVFLKYVTFNTIN